MGDRLATTDMGRKVGDCCAPFHGGLGPHVTQCQLGRGLPLTKWHLDPSSRLATIDMGRKLGAAVYFWGEGAGSPSNTMWPGPRPTSVLSGILIPPTVWPQYINVTNRTGQDMAVNRPIA